MTDDRAYELEQSMPLGLTEKQFREHADARNGPGHFAHGRYAENDIDRAWWWYSMNVEAR